jgi:hypothetical protein
LDLDGGGYSPVSDAITTDIPLLGPTLHACGGKLIFTEYEGRPELEMEFWQTFWEKAPDDMKCRRENLESAIKASRGIGLLRRYVGLDVLRFLGGSLQMMPVIKALL